ncbi:MAG: helix-turn-helix domain-containing protein [Bacteroidales bacterium]|jgi:transposase-like protein
MKISDKKELARLYYMRGESQKSVAEKVGVSPQTVNRWVDKEGWAAKRAAENITRPELVNKLLMTINKLIEQVNDSDDPLLVSGLGDKLSKLSSAIEKLDKKANVVDAIEVFMAFGRWMQYRSSYDSEITPELLKAINRYQDLYISEQISK